ncbi:MAG: SwmB domain-containing protein [bacterium]|nr:SwmB domain-containing protein [bacterium]
MRLAPAPILLAAYTFLIAALLLIDAGEIAGAQDEQPDAVEFADSIDPDAIKSLVSHPRVRSIEMRRYDGRDGQPYGIGDEINFTIKFSHNTGCSGKEDAVSFNFGIDSDTALTVVPLRGSNVKGWKGKQWWFAYEVEEGDLDANGIDIPAGDLALTGDVSTNDCRVIDRSGVLDQGPLSDHRVDGVRPVVNGAQVVHGSLNLTFDEDLDEGSVPAPEAFTVTVDGMDRAVSRVIVGGQTVMLLLSSPVAVGEEVTVSYAVPKKNPIQDLARNDADEINERTLTHSVDAPEVLSVRFLTEPGDDRTFRAGDLIEVQIRFNAAVTVDQSGGTPSLRVAIDPGTRQALYVSGSNTPELVFAYEVQAGDFDDNGIWINRNRLDLNGGAIAAGSVDADLGHGSILVGDNPVIRVDGVSNIAAATTGRETATVSATVPKSGSVYLRYRPRGQKEWQEGPPASASAPGTVEIELSGLLPNSAYQIHMSQDESFALGLFPLEFSNRPSDLDFGLPGVNKEPRGIWGNDDTLWISNDGYQPHNQVFAYTRSDGLRNSSLDFDVDSAGNDKPLGIWSDGTRMFVVDGDDFEVYAYLLSDRSHDADRDLTLAGDHGGPKGIWGNDETLWVSSETESRLFAYTRSDGSRNPDLDIYLADAGNSDARGVWSDGDIIWVIDRDDRKVYAYHLASKARQPHLDIALHRSNEAAVGLWGDSGFLYVVNGGKGGRKVFAYYLPEPEPEPQVSAVTLSAVTPASATATAWVSYHGDTERMIHLRYRPYTVAQWTVAASQRPVASTKSALTGLGGVQRRLSFGERAVASAEFVLTGLGSEPRFVVQASFDGTFSDGTEHTVELLLRPAADDFLLEAGNDAAVGIWSDGDTWWVLNDGGGGNDRVYAYDAATKAYRAEKSFDLDAANTAPRGVFADAGTMWITDRGDRVHGYGIADGPSYGTADPAVGGELGTGNGQPAGLWSDGSTMWVVGHVRERLFAYDLDESGAVGERDQSAEFDLATTYKAPRGMWSDGTTVWVVDNARHHIFAYGLSAAGFGQRQPTRDIRLAPENRDPWGIWSDGAKMWVADRGDDRVYAYFLPPAPNGAVIGVAFDRISQTSADITVTVNNPDSKSMTVTLSYSSEPGAVTDTDVEVSGSAAVFELTGLSENTRYEVSAVVDDGDPIATGGFKTQSRPDVVQSYFKDKFVPTREAAWPWVRETYDEMRRRNLIPRAPAGGGGYISTACFARSGRLDWCGVGAYAIKWGSRNHASVYAHELAHVYTIGTGYMVEAPEFRGFGWVYIDLLGREGRYCSASELYADAIAHVTQGGGHTGYFSGCNVTPKSPSDETEAFIEDILAHRIPQWLDDRYGTTGLAYDTSDDDKYTEMYDLEAFWSDLKTTKHKWHRQSAVYALQDAFGGYCHIGRARHSAFGSGATRNPWRAGGCVPQAPPVTATSDTAITWAAPRYDGGSPITKYLVEWKGPGEEFDPSRSLEVTDLSSLSYPSEHLAPGSSVRVTAYNHNGWGEPFTFTTTAPVATAPPVATGAPVITGTPQVGEELTADVSAIDDVNGVPPASEFRFQWMVVDGGADIVIAEATSSTYYPSASQVGKAIKVRASFTDVAGNDEGPLVSEPSDAVAPVAVTEVPGDWPLVPPELSSGDSFRLLFITDAPRTARSSDINAYNEWIQNQVAAGHTDIRDYSDLFRAVGSTEDTDARDNTGTTFTTADPGVPIYWLNGPKAVDHYEDFYDGDWDDEVNQRDEFGDPRDIGQVWTGSDHDGTERFNASNRTSRALGNSQDQRVRYGSPAGNGGPLSSLTLDRMQNRRMYGLSGVFEVEAPQGPVTSYDAYATISWDEVVAALIDYFGADVSSSTPPGT